MRIGEIMRLAPVIPVLVIEDIGWAAPLAQALAGGGLKVLEVTLRTPQALDAIRRMREAVPEAVVGAGTVLNGEDVKRAVDAGARFIVSPGLTANLARACDRAGVPLLAGVATCGEILGGLDLGLDHFKFFPAESIGGAAALKAIAGPLPQARFCPTGGISAENAAAYLALANVLCVGGSWVAPRQAMAAGDWVRIEGLAREAAALAP